MEDTDPSRVSVVMRTRFAADGRLLSHDVLQPLLPVLKALLPEQAREPEVLPPATARRRAAEPSLVEEHPWLAAVTSLKEPQERSDREELPDDAAEDSLGDKASEDDGSEGAGGQDGDYDELFTALENQRCALRGDVAAHSDMFRTSLLGGQWQVERTGRTIYGVRVDAKQGTTAAALCAAFKLTKECEFRAVCLRRGGRELSLKTLDSPHVFLMRSVGRDRQSKEGSLTARSFEVRASSRDGGQNACARRQEFGPCSCHLED